MLILRLDATSFPSRHVLKVVTKTFVLLIVSFALIRPATFSQQRQPAPLADRSRAFACLEDAPIFTTVWQGHDLMWMMLHDLR
jgi:hypothetical protein